MKISAEDVIPGASSVLEGSKVVFEFDTTVRFREKQQLNELVIKNGGVVSYILTKQCSFLLVSSAEKAASYRCQMARKYGVPVLAINFLTDSVSAGKILDFKKYSLSGDTSVPETTEAAISAVIPKPPVKDETKRDLKIWHPTDNNLPVFSKDNFELAKYAVFQKGKTTFYVLEIHVNKDIAIEDSPRFRVFYQISAQGSNTVEYRFSDSAEDALYAFHSLGTKITCDPQCNRMEKGARIPVDSLGTEKFRKMYRDKQSKERPSAAVTTLAHNVWREAIGELEDVLSVPTRNIKLEQVEKAEGILLQIKESLLVQPSMKDLQNLSAQFYEAIPHKQRPTIANKTMLSRKEDICQLIRDMDSVGEETHWLDRPAADAQYKALRCHLEHVRQIDIDYDLISNMVLDSIKDAKIVDVFTVRRPVEDDVFQRDLGSTRLLFHSSKPPHYLGILSRGLLLPKFVVSDNGEGNLGQGIYFAQEASVSSKYSVRNPLTGSRYMLVCEVALGRKAEVFSPQFDLTCPPQGYHSVHGVAATSQRPSFFKDDEYVVYDSSQQRLRYLVEYLCPNDRLIEPKEGPGQDLRPPNYCPIDYSTLQHDVEAVTAVDDPLSRVESGLLGPGSAAVPLKAVHIRARLLDLSAQVVVLQTYRNDENAAIEAKYVFPLDDLAAVCGFEAFINGKHVVGQVKEKAQAHREYKEAVKQGHGAYLMDQDTETPDVFTVSVGNLPPKATVLIKITYVVELQTEAGLINFSIPASVAPWKRDQAQQETTQTSVETVKVELAVAEDTSLQVSVNMPFDIKSIDSPTHSLRIKSTACRAVLELEKNQSLEGGFQLLIGLSQIHVPRMWVEEHPDDPDSQACMLTFYPEVDNIASQVSEITLLLDMSNSMDGKPAKDAVTLVLLLLAQLDKNTKFNVIVFGTESEEVFHQPEDASEKNKKRFSEFMKKNVTVTLGGTDLYTPLHRLLLLQPSSSPLNVLLLSDGHISNEQLIFSDLLNSVTTLRLFTLGISETANRHRLRSLARVGRGAFEYFDNKVKSKWETKVKSVLYRVSQPSLSSVQVEWHQYDNDPPAPIQAPRQIMSLFSGSRQVVYGFVPNCQMATLKAVVDGKEVSTVVSSSDLSNTKGLILHRLTARGLIRDWEDGILAFDRSKHEAEKMGLKDYIIGISKEYAIVTQLTSFVAVEERTKDEKFVTDPGHQLEELLQAEAVDDLQYMGWQTLQAKAPIHQREAEIELEVEEQGCFDPESMSDDRSDESLSDEGSDESLYDEESDEASSDDLCGFCLYEDDSVTASAFSSGGGVGSPLSQENGIEDIAEQCGFMDQGPWLPVEDEMLHCNKMGFIAQDIDSTFGECEYNEDALMSSHSWANVLAAPSAPQELDTFDTPVLKANENTSSLAYLSPDKAMYLSIEKKAVDKSISSLMSDTIDKVKERSEDLKSLVEKSVNLSEGLVCFSKSSVQKHEKTDKKKTGIFASKPESLKLPKGRRMGGRPSAAAMSSNEAHPKTQQIPLSRSHVATGAVDLFDIQPAIAPPRPPPPPSQISAQFAMSAPSAFEPTAPHPVSEDFCRKGSFKLSKVETLPTAHSKPPPPASSIDMIRTSLAPAVPVRKSQLSAMAASVPVEPKPTMVKTKPLESPASQGLDSVVTASQDMLCASRRRQPEGRSISRYLCSLSRKSLRNKQLQSFGGPQQPLDRAAFAESDYQPEEHFLSLDISMKASSDSQPIKEAAPEPLKKASKVMCSSGSRGGRASLVHRKVMSDVPKNQPLLDSSLLPQGVIMNEKAKTGIQALSKSVSFMSFDTVFKAQRNDGSWEFCPSVFTELMMDYDKCRNTLYSAGLKSFGWRVEQAILSLTATAIVLGQFLSFLLPHQFPSTLQLTAPNFQLDIDIGEAQDQIRKALDGYTDNSAAVYAVVMRAVRFCEETINAHPMVCSQLELGRSWEYFLANINGFMDNKASMF